MKKRDSRQSEKLSGFFGWFSRRKETARSRAGVAGSPWVVRLKVAFAILVWACVGAGITMGFIYLERYIRTQGPSAQKTGPMELTGVPDWLEPKWIETITQTAGGRQFHLDEQSARIVAEKLKNLSWMEQIRVKATPTVLQVQAVFRKPVARVKIRENRWVYLDAERAVLDPLPLESLTLAEIRGIAAESIPPPGGLCHAEEADAAIQILKKLEQMDQRCCPDKPLLSEIDSIDMSNLAKRKNTSKPHIILFAKDQTPIYWGAAWGKAAVYLEADEAEKLTMLYNFYAQNGNTLLGKVKYIELRTPVIERPRPR